MEAPKPVDVPAPVEQPKPAEVPAAAPVADAISADFNTGLGSVSVNVSNSSDLNGKCTYDASPFGTHRDFNVPAHGSTSLSFSGLNTGTTYQVSIVCNDASGKQSGPIGQVNQSVTF